MFDDEGNFASINYNLWQVVAPTTEMTSEEAKQRFVAGGDGSCWPLGTKVRVRAEWQAWVATQQLGTVTGALIIAQYVPGRVYEVRADEHKESKDSPLVYVDDKDKERAMLAYKTRFELAEDAIEILKLPAMSVEDKNKHFNTDSSGWWPVGTHVTVREDYMEYSVSGESGTDINNKFRFVFGMVYTVCKGANRNDDDPYVCGMFAYKSRFDRVDAVAVHESSTPTNPWRAKSPPPAAMDAAPAHTINQKDGLHWLAGCIVTPNLDMYMSDPEFEKVVSPGTEYAVAQGAFYNWFDHSGVPYSVHAFVTHFDLVRPPPEEN